MHDYGKRKGRIHTQNQMTLSSIESDFPLSITDGGTDDWDIFTEQNRETDTGIYAVASILNKLMIVFP